MKKVNYKKDRMLKKIGKKDMGKIGMFLVMSIFLLSSVSALIDLGTFEQTECVPIKQTCDNCTFVNLTSVSRTGSNSTVWTIGEEMTKSDVNFNYSFCTTNTLGDYQFTVKGDKDGTTVTEEGIFSITPSGREGTDNIILFLVLIGIIYGITLLGFFGKNQTLTIIGGMAMMGLGLYFIINGIIVYRDWFTNYLSYVTIALGFFFAMYPILEEYFDF